MLDEDKALEKYYRRKIICKKQKKKQKQAGAELGQAQP